MHLPTIAAQCAQLAEQALRERRSHLGFLEALLQAELEEREQRLVERRVRQARLPRMKMLEEFDFAQCPRISPQQIHELAEGGYIERAKPIIFIGESGTGKTHLLTGLAVAACRQKRRVRFATAAALAKPCDVPRTSAADALLRSCAISTSRGDPIVRQTPAMPTPASDASG